MVDNMSSCATPSCSLLDQADAAMARGNVREAASLLELAAQRGRDASILLRLATVRRELSNRWWLIPSAALVPVVAFGATASTIAQAVLAAAAIGGNLLRAARRPVLRRVLISALVIAAAGVTIGSLSDPPSLCRADGLLPRHAIWHVLAAAALWRLATVIGARRASSQAEVTTVPVGSPL